MDVVMTPELVANLQLPLSEAGLSTRSLELLERVEVYTVEDLLHCTLESLVTLPHVGDKTIRDIFVALVRLGFVPKRKLPALVQRAHLLQSQLARNTQALDLPNKRARARKAPADKKADGPNKRSSVSATRSRR